MATIYGKSKAYPQYRVAWHVNGQRRMKAFDRYGGENGALAYAQDLVPDLAKGSKVTALTPHQASDALAAIERLDVLRQTTGKRVSLLAAVSEFAEATTKLGDGLTLGDALERYLNTVAAVSRIDLSQAVEEFIRLEETRTKATDGRRAQLSPKYAYNRAIMLRRFAGAFQNTAVCDLAKAHLDTFIESLDATSRLRAGTITGPQSGNGCNGRSGRTIWREHIDSGKPTRCGPNRRTMLKSCSTLSAPITSRCTPTRT